MTGWRSNRARLVKAAIVLLAGLGPVVMATSCGKAPAPPSDSGRNDVCGDGLTDCGAASCRELDSDPNHCGQCGAACQVGQECRGGSCECFAPYERCGDTCVDTRSSPANCGACGTACSGALPYCSQGACAASCAAGLSECGTACINVTGDALNCGACGAACGAGQTCANSRCACVTAGQQVCAGQCTDVLTNTQHCGSCNAPCPAGQTCGNGVCSGGGTGGTGGGGGSAGSAGSGATDGGSGSGYQVGSMCFPACTNATTDPDDAGVSDGYGYENGRSCVVPGSAPTMGAPRCEPPPVMTPDSGIPPGDGFYIGNMCFPRCASDATDPDDMGVRDGYGYEQGRSCVVVGSAPTMGVPTCVPAGVATGDGWLVDMRCVPACTHPEWVEDAQGYGYEAQQTCIVTGSMAATQNARCMLMPRTDLPPPGNGFQNGGTCYPPCSASAADVTTEGYGWEANRNCIVPGSKASVQGVPCVPPPSTVTGECPRTLACPVVNNVTLGCGCTWVEGLAARKAVIMGTAGATQYFLASAMMETERLLADYTLGDGKTGDAFNAGLAKQNWGMIRRCHPAWNSQTADQFMTSVAMNSSLSLDIQVYTECRNMFGTQWWAGHRNGYNNLGSNTQDIQEFKAAMDWTNTELAGHLADDVRFWVTIRPI